MEQQVEDISVTENVDASTGSSQTVEIMEAPPPNESTSNVMADKQTKNRKNKTGSKASKIMKADSGKMKAASQPDKKILKRKAEHPPTSEMVMDSIMALKKPRGATFDDIKKHMEENYAVNMNVLKSHVNKFLQKSVDNGKLERVDGAKGEGKFKIKKPESIKKSSRSLNQKEKQRKPEKKLIVLNKKLIEPKKKAKK